MSSDNSLQVVVGDLFESEAQTIVNTVNTVGVMGKGVALEFRRRFPDMYDDYVRRCKRGEVRLGEPYLYPRLLPPNILNFPTKEHWRSASRLSDITAGLEYLEAHYRDWGITSLAVPPLGCGHGGLDWSVVGPTLYRHLSQFEIPVELYAPYGTPHAELEPTYLARSEASARSSSMAPVERPRVEPSSVALVAVLDRLYSDPHHWPVGRTSFQKLAYFATAASLPTGLTFRKGSYGPYSPDLSGIVSSLVNNDLVGQKQLGRMLAYTVGGTFESAQHVYEANLDEWRPKVERVADLFARLRRTRDTEIAATVHFVASELSRRLDRPPDEDDVLREVMEWKQSMRPRLDASDVLLSMRSLAMLGWLSLTPSPDLESDEGRLVGINADLVEA